MRKYLILLVLLFGVVLVSCKKNEEDYPPDKELQLLPYYNYLKKDNPVVTIKIKDFGEIKVELFPSVAKVTVDNFIKYVQESAYVGSTFHRIIEDFMIQGGIVRNAFPPIVGEFSSNGITNDLKHDRGVISMARTGVKNSATSQFFIVHKVSPHLDGEYAGFGGVIEGLDILDKVAEVETNSNDVPLTSIVIENVTINLRGYKN